MTDQASRRRIEWAAFAAVLLVAAVLRLMRLDDNGVGTAYYAAGVRSMLQGVWLFFYNSFDPAGFISLDKPPIAFWIQTIFAAVLGYSGWAIHLPQALAGIASVALLYRLVRPLGVPAAIVAALLLAIMPIAVAVDRSNNTDSWLIFFLLLAARIALRGRGLSLVVAMALLGLAFNTKMLAALVCGPALLAGWLLAGTLNWRQRLGWMTAAAVTLAVVSLSWAVAFDLTPKAKRPYAGSSHDNSMLELIVMHNGLERFVRNRPHAGARANARPDDALRRLRRRAGGPPAARRARAGQCSSPGRCPWRCWALCSRGGGVARSRGAVGGLGSYLRHRLQRRRRHLPRLLPRDAGPAARGTGRHRGRCELWRRGSMPRSRWAWQRRRSGKAIITGESLGWTVDAGSAFRAVALLAAATAAQWRDRRPPAVIGGVALLVLPAVWSLSADLRAGNLTLPSASLPRWLGMDDGRGPILSRNWTALTDDPKLHGVPAGTSAALRVFCWPRPMRCWRRRSSSAPASR